MALCLIACKKEYEVIMPDTSTWADFNSTQTTPIPFASRTPMEGIYGLTAGASTFGEITAIKWSYAIRGADTTYHLSGFFGTDIAYFICEGKRLHDSLLFNGYWRKMVSTQSGIMRLTINPTNGSNILLGSAPVVDSNKVTIAGVFGNGNDEPRQPISFTYQRKLHKDPTTFHILAHRSGGRSSDLLPVSENSVAMILKTPEFGSTGIEIDVRMTKDGVPILYHDNNLNLRLVQKSGLIGPIENYTYDQLNAFVRLIHGERIPTLREALNAVLYQTPLTFVWLDTKYVGPMDKVQAMQTEFLQKAAAAGRNLQIVIGLPTEDALNDFLKLPNYASTPALCELSLDDVKKTNAKIWAPRFTEGTQNANVDLVHAQGRLAFVWTLDVPGFTEQFIREGKFDGILSNFPSNVAFYYYAKR